MILLDTKLLSVLTDRCSSGARYNDGGGTNAGHVRVF